MKDMISTSFELTLTAPQREWSISLLRLLNWINLGDCFNQDDEVELINEKIKSQYSKVDGFEDLHQAVETIFEVSGEPKESFLEMRLFDIESLDDGIRISGNYIAEDFLAAFVQVIIARFELKPKGYSIANHCNDLLVDSFGGSAFYVTSTEIRTINMQSWLESQA